MKKTFLYFKTAFFLIPFLFSPQMNLADEMVIDSETDKKNELLIEADKQSSNFKESVFYAEGNVVLTNSKNEFIAKSKKAIFYKLQGNIRLIGDVNVFTNDSNTIKAAEVIYYVNEKRFEAISDKTQRVKTFIYFEN